jgi:hypothetical protein
MGVIGERMEDEGLTFTGEWVVGEVTDREDKFSVSDPEGFPTVGEGAAESL